MAPDDGNGSVPRMVLDGLDRLEKTRIRVMCTQASTYAGRARRLGRIAELYEREARWWAVLARWRHDDVYTTLACGRASLAAEFSAERSGEFYREYESRE